MSENPFRVLFVCSGNSCRSPIAEGLLRMKLPSRLQTEVEIQSAGTLGINGMPATDHAISMVEELGSDIHGHRSQGVTHELISRTDLVLAMAGEHIAFLQRHFPSYRENFFLLRRFANDHPPADPDIADPVGMSKAIYRNCAQLIAEELDRVLPAIVKMIQERRHAQ